MRSRGKDPEAALLQERKSLVASRLDHGDGKHRASRGAHHVRVVDVGRAVADYHRRYLRRVSGAQYRAEVARLLDGLGDDDERVLRKPQIGKPDRDMRPYHQKPVRPLLVGNLREACPRARVDLRSQPGAIFHQRRLVLVLQIAVGTVEDRSRTVTAVKGAAALAIALDDHLAGLLARRAASQLHDVLQLRVRR